MNARFIIFISVVTVALAVACFYVGTRWIGRSEWAYQHRYLIALGLSLFVVLQLLGPLLYRSFPDRLNWHFFIQWITYSTLGTFASLLFYMVVADLGLMLWAFLTKPENNIDLERRSFIGVGLMTVTTTVIGIIQAEHGPKIYEVNIPIPNLPEGLDGFRIAQISDLHVGPTIRRSYTENVVNLVNGMNADVIALTGDFIDGSVELLREHIEPLTHLKARYGSFFVTGNHEYYWGALEWIKEFKRMGAKVLLNSHEVIIHQGHPIVFAGVPDKSAGRFFDDHTLNAAKALEGAPNDAIKILLAHNPDAFNQASEAGYHLQLSGHTHGGQFFPWTILVKLVHRYTKGLYRHEKMWVYVNRGTGYWGPPIRFTVPSEVTLIKLTRPSPIQS